MAPSRQSLTFISDACLAPQLRRRPRPLRRPRRPLSSALVSARPCVPRAVFLPPEGPPPIPDDDLDDDDITDSGLSGMDDDKMTGLDDSTYNPSASEDDPPEYRRGSGAGGGVGGGAGRVDTLDRLLAETQPDYDTWADRNSKRSLTAFRPTSQSMLGADELNESLRPTHLQRHRHVLAPDEAFGAIFTWDVIVSNARELERLSWEVVAEENGRIAPDLDDIVRAEHMAPEAAVSRVFYWTRDWGEIKRAVFRKREVLAELELSFVWEKAPGVDEFLSALDRHGVKCILCTTRPRKAVEPVMQSLGLDTYFSKNEIVSADDEFDSMEQMLLVASLKSERPPGKCVLFADKPAAITAGHEVTSKVVALLGTHAAYELKTADHIVSEFNELVVYNVRRLFAEEGQEFMDPQTELEVERM